MISVNFKEGNILSILVDCNSEIEDYIIIIEDENENNYSTYGISNQSLDYTTWGVANLVTIQDNKSVINYHANCFFKYKIKLISQNDGVLKIIDEKLFDINQHDFLISLKSDDKKEIKIWQNYLKLVESILGKKINYTINTIPDKVNDTIEISKYYYDIYIKESEEPLRETPSSLTIIKSLFNIL